MLKLNGENSSEEENPEEAYGNHNSVSDLRKVNRKGKTMQKTPQNRINQKMSVAGYGMSGFGGGF